MRRGRWRKVRKEAPFIGAVTNCTENTKQSTEKLHSINRWTSG